ncbi:BTAD domain-containing putative transcriptional regulator [Microbispora sp. KK1-11]|uniref:BTAD domain-containing putative transcriptional regulator n=1 Tax=Microbispora sp. KK1-11 TaxID=2053005 RepID=UPI00115C09CC|nr:BTAD domain-containing putative transcriptional regulator [Microbispora sp. KK1-11]TQS28511.1 AAA family ATPase [Microbispora sp. KK1-11]
MAVMFRVLGPVEAYVDGVPVDLGGPRPRLLVARLLVARGATVSVDAILDDLYDGTPPPRAQSTLHSYISNLRRVLEPGRAPRTPSSVLLSRPPGYALGPHEVDADEFVRLAQAGEPERALALWRGMPYEEFGDVPWLRPEIERLAEAHLVTRERLLAGRVGDPHVVGELEALVAAHPLREGLWELLARTLYALGRQADALEALRTARAHLAEELGLDPGPALRRLEEAILAQDPALDGPAPVRQGRAAPIEAARAEAARADRPERRAVGRGTQFDRLDELARDVIQAARGVAQRGPGIAVISGEPGIGKTWLAEAFAGRRAAEGWLVAWGRCHETSGAPALWPWQQVVRDLAARVPPSPAQAAALRVLLGDAAPGDDPAPEAGRPAEASEARFRLHQATAAYLETAAADRPLLVAIDDLQWADTASLGLLSDLALLLRGAVAIVITVRSGEGPAVVHDTLGLLGRHDALRLPLAGLDPAAVAELSGLRDAASVAALAERTRGNPLFIRETLRLAEDQGIERALTGVPEGLADVLRRRLLDLPARHRPAIDAAAVLGTGADRRLLAEVVADASGADVDEALDAATTLRVLDEDLRFTHDLVRETVYADIPPRRRAGLHLAALRALELRPGADLAVLARHALAGGPAAAADAVRWASATAGQAAGRHAYEDAAQWWRRAVEAHGTLPGADPREHVELLLQLVRAQLAAGHGFSARQTRAEAVLAADRSGDPLLAARALTSLDAPGLWKFYTYGDIELHTVRRIEDALTALPEGDSELRCRLLGCLGMERYDGSADPRCDTATAEALSMARRLVASGEAGLELLAITLNARYLGVQLPEHMAELDAIGEELTGLGLPGFELLGYMIRERTRIDLFDMAGADRAAERAGVLVERLDLPWPRFQHLIWTGTRRLLDGDFEGAGNAYAAAAEAGERLNLWHTSSTLSSALLTRHFAMRDFDGAEELMARYSPFPAHRQVMGVLIGDWRGDRTAAEAAREQGWHLLPRDFGELPGLCLQGEAQIVAGDHEACALTYRRLLPYEDRIAFGAGTFCAGPVGYYLGRMAYLGRAAGPETARAHLDTAAKRCVAAGLTWWAARIAREREAVRG